MSYQPSQDPVDPDVKNEIEEQELLNTQQSQALPAHNKRRIYPQQAFDYAQASPSPDIGYANANPAYNPAAAQAAPVAPAVGYSNPAEPAAQAYYTPATPQYGYPGVGTDGLNKQMSNVTLGPGFTAANPPAARAQDQRFPPAPQIPHTTPLNELYNIDLLQELPPPIADLSLPPPPINLPPSASVSLSPDVNCPLPYMRSTLNAVPHTASLLKKSKLPFAVVVQPFAALRDDEAPIPVIADNIVSRCRRCRTYINPFVTFIDQGNRWRCCMCNLTNDVPAGFDWNHQAQKQEDRWARKELNYGAFEFIAPPEYMVRPPEPLTYLFLIDVSVNAVNSGLLATTARTILESLDRIPNQDQRTRLGFICVDSSLHYLSIPLPGSPSNEPCMLVVGDLDEPFLPQPQSLLVSLSESRQGIEILLERLNNMFANNLNSNNAMGPALRSAHKLIAHCGGRILCFMASLPNTGAGKLEVREDKKMLGTSKETALLNTGNSFYKSFAVECSKSQVSVDMFLFSSHYQDVASLSCLPRYTAGQTFFYPGWNAGRTEDAVKFAHELSEHLSQEVGLEGVLRVRATSGLRMATFYGNFFNRSSDLCAFPSIPRDQSYVIDISFDETMTRPFVALQTAVLYTSCNSERRIRVLTLALPTTNSLADIYSSADQKALMAYYTHKTIEKALSNGLEEARKHVTNKLVELLKVYRKELMATNLGSSAPLQFCANLRMLPLLSLALIKHIGIRKSAKISSDMRSAAICLLTTLPVKYLIQYLHADMYSLHDMPDEAGLPDADTGAIVMPPKMNLTGESIQRYGLYLIDDGQTQFLYIGRDAVPQLIEDVFGLPSLEHVVGGKTTIPVLENDFNLRVNAVIAKSRERLGSVYWPNLYVVREDGDPALKLWASTFLIQDRTDQAVSYVQYLTLLREQVSA